LAEISTEEVAMATVATVEGGKASGQTKIVAAKKQATQQPQTPGLAMQLTTLGRAVDLV